MHPHARKVKREYENTVKDLRAEVKKLKRENEELKKSISEMAPESRKQKRGSDNANGSAGQPSSASMSVKEAKDYISDNGLDGEELKAFLSGEDRVTLTRLLD